MKYEILLPALISLISAITVVLISEIIRRKKEKKEKNDQINLEYLNPLRLYLEEVYVRLKEINERLDKDKKIQALDFIKNSEELSKKDKTWFINEGVYLVSSCYFTACLFSMIKLVRDDIPYLRLGKRSDTKLLNLMFEVSHAFLQNHGIYYAIQHSIGEEMYLKEEDRIITYREFCNKLLKSDDRVWFDRLISFFIATGNNQNTQRIKTAIDAINNLSKFLDINIRGGASINERLKAEKLL